MNRTRTVLGLIAGVMFVLSSAAHSLLGWEGLQGQLAGVNAPAELVVGLQIGWYFGGLAMLVFGIVTLLIFGRRLRGGVASLAPARVISVAYFLFGVWALAVTSFDPFFLVFIVPAVLLGVAAFARE